MCKSSNGYQAPVPRWRPPTEQQSRNALEEPSGLEVRPAISAGLEHGLFELKRPPGPGDWLNGRGISDRKGQTFGQWEQRCGRRPNRGDVIWVVPLGNFTVPVGDVFSGKDNYLDAAWCAACLQAFVHGLRVEVLPAIPGDILLREVTHRDSRGHGPQLLTSDLQKWLRTYLDKREAEALDFDPQEPHDCDADDDSSSDVGSQPEPQAPRGRVFATMAFTMFDLYPGSYAEFVYGQGNPSLGVGVLSFARYLYVDPLHFKQRCSRVLCHEFGHLFGLKHCIWYECLMAGSAGDWESDRQPLHLCPVCLAKLHKAIEDLDLIARETALERFWLEVGDDDEADWCRRRRRLMNSEEDAAWRQRRKEGMMRMVEDPDSLPEADGSSPSSPSSHAPSPLPSRRMGSASPAQDVATVGRRKSSASGESLSVANKALWPQVLAKKAARGPFDLLASAAQQQQQQQQQQSSKREASATAAFGREAHASPPPLVVSSSLLRSRSETALSWSTSNHMGARGAAEPGRSERGNIVQSQLASSSSKLRKPPMRLPPKATGLLASASPPPSAILRASSSLGAARRPTAPWGPATGARPLLLTPL
eukprot:TRINITY_DN15684_c0_g1_i7.p1 TRINITY_DN15684_c0_g1~~TRINITY_DN15684_c0_g1_i7.p1  ORF type:complete len:592 (+),score=110.17 TRINITY_DN15684_c0_g1_i7:150-1925(+)